MYELPHKLPNDLRQENRKFQENPLNPWIRWQAPRRPPKILQANQLLNISYENLACLILSICLQPIVQD